MQIKLLVEGGNMQPGPALSQKLGPAGINVGQVIQKVNEATKNFKGIKVPVELDVNVSTKEINVNVFSPPASELIKKELGIEKGSGKQNKLYASNASIEQIISVAKTKFPNMLAKNLKSAVKSIVGTCATLGVLVEDKQAIKVISDIDEGKYDSEIKQEKTETSPEKRAKLDEYFSKVKDEQEKIIKQEEAAKEAAVAETAETPEGTEKAGEAEAEKKEEPEIKKK